jgi:hypothetical protein
MIFLAATVFAGKHFFRDDVEYDDIATILAKYDSGAGFIGSDEYAPLRADNSTVAAGLPDACVASDYDTELGIAATSKVNPVWRADQGSCIATATAAERSPEHLHITTVASQAGFLILRLRSYPAWRVMVNGQRTVSEATRMDGLIAVPVTKGPVDLTVDWTTTPDVISGRWVSTLALAGLIALGLLERKPGRRRPA